MESLKLGGRSGRVSSTASLENRTSPGPASAVLTLGDHINFAFCLV